MSDEAAERLLSPVDLTGEAASPLRAVVSELRAAGQSPPSEAVAERHLAAIVSEVRRPSEAAAGASPRRAGRARVGALPRLLPPRLAGGFTAFTAFAALVVAGALPGPVQAAAADVLGVVGISVPDGRSVAKPDTEPTSEPVRRTVTPGDSSPERKAAQPQRAHPAARHADRDRSETPAGRERDQADDGARESRDDEGDESSGDDGDERRPDTDREPDDDGSGREPDAEEDADDDSSGEGPGAGSIDTGDVDTIDRIDDSESGSDGRSGSSDTPLPEPDSTEE